MSPPRQLPLRRDCLKVFSSLPTLQLAFRWGWTTQRSLYFPMLKGTTGGDPCCFSAEAHAHIFPVRSVNISMSPRGRHTSLHYCHSTLLHLSPNRNHTIGWVYNATEWCTHVLGVVKHLLKLHVSGSLRCACPGQRSAWLASTASHPSCLVEKTGEVRLIRDLGGLPPPYVSIHLLTTHSSSRGSSTRPTG